MNKCSLLLLSILFLSACDGSGSGINIPVAANPDVNVDVNEPDGSNSGGGTDVVEPVSIISRIQGEITLHNELASTGEVNIRVRNTDVSTVMQASGKFALDLPQIDSERTVILDLSGPNIVSDSVSLPIPADAVRVLVSANIAGRSPPITFSLDNGGEMTNLLSPTRVSVTVPAAAFEFADGTLAIGDAEVSITEIDIEDLNGEGAWAPNLLGIGEGMSEESVLATLGMSDFHFSQDGRELQLRLGKSATIKTDMVTTVIIPKGETVAVQAAEGMIVPLWFYDTVDMIWKEEGESVVVIDSDSETGFSLSGQVSHFTTWNHDFVVPWTTILVNVRLIDGDGELFSGLSVSSHTATASIVSAQGTDSSGSAWSYDSNWVETRNSSGSSSSMHMIAGNLSGEAEVTASAFDLGSTTMDFEVSNVVAEGSGIAVMLTNSGSASKIFNNSDSDREITLDVVVEEDEDDFVELTHLATVQIELVDLNGQVRSDVNVVSYVVTAESDTSDWENQQSMSPQSNQMAVQANTQEQIDNGETVTTEFTLNNLIVGVYGEVDLLFPVTGTKIFKTFDSDDTITLQVPIIDL